MNPKLQQSPVLWLVLEKQKKKLMETMDDLRANNVNILTIGQYLQPSKKHLLSKNIGVQMNLMN